MVPPELFFNAGATHVFDGDDAPLADDWHWRDWLHLPDEAQEECPPPPRAVSDNSNSDLLIDTLLLDLLGGDEATAAAPAAADNLFFAKEPQLPHAISTELFAVVLADSTLLNALINTPPPSPLPSAAATATPSPLAQAACADNKINQQPRRKRAPRRSRPPPCPPPRKEAAPLTFILQNAAAQYVCEACGVAVAFNAYQSHKRLCLVGGSGEGVWDGTGTGTAALVASTAPPPPPRPLIVCSTCGMTYKTTFTKDRHELSCRNRRLYACECARRFTRPDLMKRHQVTYCKAFAVVASGGDDGGGGDGGGGDGGGSFCSSSGSGCSRVRGAGSVE
ncbi:hypothetical protein DFJ73DRAFT_768379 [Zopfochytrium polystomum]|nr:hypothetical protein DFJ73DRAFT_768379 [Zopfochytrium polystomum]